MDPTDIPAEAPTAHVAKRVRELRKAYGWSAQKLAEEMTKVGVEWNRGVVNKLENGRRESVSIVDLFALAWAFDVPPVALLMPDNPEAKYQVTPKVERTAHRVFRWIWGASPPPLEPSTPDEHPGERGARMARYIAAMPNYMTRPDSDLDRAVVADAIKYAELVQEIGRLTRLLQLKTGRPLEQIHWIVGLIGPAAVDDDGNVTQVGPLSVSQAPLTPAETEAGWQRAKVSADVFSAEVERRIAAGDFPEEARTWPMTNGGIVGKNGEVIPIDIPTENENGGKTDGSTENQAD